jgi:hypothetical protein
MASSKYFYNNLKSPQRNQGMQSNPPPWQLIGARKYCNAYQNVLEQRSLMDSSSLCLISLDEFIPNASLKGAASAGLNSLIRSLVDFLLPSTRIAIWLRLRVGRRDLRARWPRLIKHLSRFYNPWRHYGIRTTATRHGTQGLKPQHSTPRRPPTGVAG